VERLSAMNWKRGLFRAWLVAAIFWIVGFGWYYHIATCFLEALRGHPQCGGGWGDEGQWRVVVPIWEAIAMIIGPPPVVLVLGLLLLWIGRGFRLKP
jgi:hypothetical protein